jgi:hypothetical protein
MPDNNFEEFVGNWPHFQKRLVVFLGAGASIGARNRTGRKLPNAYELRNSVWEKLKHEPGMGAFDPAELRLMTLEHAAAIIEAKTGRTVLDEYLREQFDCDKPLWPHAVLPFVGPVSLFTTNYDELVELGYKNSPSVLNVECGNRRPPPGRTVLYKPHGSLGHSNQPIGHGGLIITQFDYFEMIADYRGMLRKAMTEFSSTCVLFVGYSFGDMDIGAILYDIRKHDQNIPWYAVFPRDDQQVRRMYSRHFGINQINKTFETFLAELDERVSFIPAEHAEWKHANRDELVARGRIQLPAP